MDWEVTHSGDVEKSERVVGRWIGRSFFFLSGDEEERERELMVGGVGRWAERGKKKHS